MINKRWVRFTTILSLVLLVPLLLCPSVLHAKTTLRVGVGYSDQLNQSTQGSANNFEVLLTYRLLTELGYHVNFVVAPYSKLTQLLQQHKLDLATRQSVMQPLLWYTEPYVEFHNQVFALKSFAGTLPDLAALTRYKIVSFQNANVALGPEFSAVANIAPGYQEVFDHTQAVQMLLKGRTQLLVLDSATFYHRLQEMGADPAQIQSFDLLPKVQYRIATQDKLLQQQVSQLLQQWQQSGQLQQIRREARISTTDIVKLLRANQH